jgi:ribosomal protein S18 acetylase RimI-like enzyme
MTRIASFPTPFPPISLRHTVTPADHQQVRLLVASTGFFSPAEVDVAAELVGERLAKGPASGYEFVFAEAENALLGYACFGPIPATTVSFDLYWIAVHATQQRRGLGRRLLAETERQVVQAGGRRLYVDTSNRPQYATTRAFYTRCGYRVEAVLQDFYAPGDDKVIFVKILTDSESGVSDF